MAVLRIVMGIIYLIISIALIIIVMIQESNTDGVAAMTGQSDAVSNTKGSKKKKFLSKLTIVLGILFAVAAIIMTVLIQL